MWSNGAGRDRLLAGCCAFMEKLHIALPPPWESGQDVQKDGTSRSRAFPGTCSGNDLRGEPCARAPRSPFVL